MLEEKIVTTFMSNIDKRCKKLNCKNKGDCTEILMKITLKYKIF